jgi:hypothetical protein
MALRWLGLLSLCDILAFPSRCGVFEEEIFNTLKTNVLGSYPLWNGKFINMAGRVSLVKSVLASQAIYHLTPLNIPLGTMKYLNKIERAFTWAAKEKASGAKCKVNWETMCRSKIYGVLEYFTWKNLHRLYG